MPKPKTKTDLAIVKDFPCTECGRDATIGYVAGKSGDWNGKVRIGERLCTACFQKRGGERFF